MPTTEQRPTNTIADELAANAAKRKLQRTELYRLVRTAAGEQHMNQRKIAALAELSQPEIHRILNRVKDDPSLVERTPGEIINEHLAGQISADEMMHQLLAWDYTFGHVPGAGEHQLDAYVTGSWDEVESAYYRGLLSEIQFRQLFERNASALDRASRP